MNANLAVGAYTQLATRIDVASLVKAVYRLLHYCRTSIQADSVAMNAGREPSSTWMGSPIIASHWCQLVAIGTGLLHGFIASNMSSPSVCEAIGA